VIPVMDFLCAKHGVRGAAAVHASTAPLIGEMKQARFALPESRLANESVVDFVGKNRVRNVLLVAKWLGHLDNNSETKLRERMSDTVEQLHQAGAKVWILKQVPKPRWHVPTLLASALFQKKDPSMQGWRVEEFAAETERQTGLFLNPDPRFGTARILDPAPVFAEGAEGRYRIFYKGKALYCDESHLSVAGSMFLRDLFEPIFSNQGPAGSGNGSR